MEVLRIAADALKRHKLRSFLTLLGVIIGVATVVSVVSITAGLNDYIKEKVFQLSPDVFVVTKFGIITSREEFLAAVRRKNIDADDVRAIRDRCPHCAQIGVNNQSRMPVKYSDKSMLGVQVFGSSANMAELNNVDLEAGRFFTESEVEHSTPVAVIGSDVRDQLFGKSDPVGRVITLSGKPLKVIGLLRKQGSVLGQSQDNQLYLPISAYRKNFGTRSSMDLFIRAAGGLANMELAEDEVRTVLRGRRHTPFKGNDPFGLVTAEALQQVWKSISASAFALMTFISGIALMVGGIVIMNIMLVSVVERTREIGIRRALGARKSDIRWQFLTEAMLLSLLGGTLGVTIGFVISKIISTATPLPTLVRPSLIFAGLGIAVLTGLIAGLFPAQRAANLPPVEALRWE